MSRNIRQKYPQMTAKAAKRRGSDTTTSFNLTTDDENGYSAVEDVSDSDEDDEEHVDAAEEEHLISMGPPRPMEPEDDDADEEADDDDEDEVEDDDDDDALDENDSWEGILTEDETNAVEELSSRLKQDEANAERHVRFTGVPDSESDSTTSETSEDHKAFFPDIFVAKTALDPTFRREIENDDDSSHSGSFWDFQYNSQGLIPLSDGEVFEDSDSTPFATPMPSGMATVASTPTPPAEAQELDGYETDGDTTEEDVPEPPVRRKLMRRVSHIDPSSDSETDKPTPLRHGKPRLGRFNLDKSHRKPIAVVNPATRKMMIFTPERLSRLDLSPESFQIDFAAQGLPGCSPFLSNPGYVMMGAMLSSNTFGDLMNTQPFGPAEAFFPLESDPPPGEDSDDSMFRIPGEDDEEDKLKLEDFITFNQDSSDEEEEELGLEYGDITIGSSPIRPQTAASGMSVATDSSVVEVVEHPLMAHFGNNSESVGAFRRNQIDQQLIYSDKASSESLAFGTPYHYGTLRGIKTGSMETVTTPITPARRHKKSNTVSMQGFDVTGSPQQKRKASSNFTGNVHKKQRSISELPVDILQI